MTQIKDFPQKVLANKNDKLLIQDSSDNAYKYVEVQALEQLDNGGSKRNYYDRVLFDTPDYYFRFGETEGSIAFDSSGYERHATYNNVQLNQPSLLSGDSNPSAYFLGTLNSFASFNSIYVGNAFTGIAGITVECIVSGFDTAGIATILHLGRHNNPNFFTGMAFGIRNRKMEVHVPGINLIDSGFLIGKERTHLAWVVKKNSGSNYCYFSFYVNGVLCLPDRESDVNQPTTTNATIGKLEAADAYPGFLDELSIYGVNLTSETIYSHYKLSLLPA